VLSDKGCERAVLSGICQYGSDGFFEVNDILESSVFTDMSNQLIFSCLEYLFAADIKKVDVSGIFSAANSLKIEKQVCESKQNQEFIRSLFNFPIELSNLRSYAIKIVNLSIARNAQGKLQKAYRELEGVTGDEDTNKIIDITESPYSTLMKELVRTEDGEDIGENIEEYVKNKFDNPIKNVGIPSPFPIFNSVIGDGLRPGVHLCCARLKAGKSSFAKEIAIHISKNLNIPVLWVDTEMSEEEQKDRILAGFSSIDIRKVEKGNLNQAEKDKLLYSAKELKNIPLKHQRVSGKSFSDILSIIRRWINHKVGYNDSGERNPHFVVYDYFKLMDTSELKDMQEYQAMGFQIAALHDFCMENNTPVLSFVQINRDGINKESTDVIAQSDRLGWNAISLCIWKRKTPEEIGQNPKAGTHKLVPLEGRFMSKLDPGDYINYYFDEAKSKITELKTRFQSESADFGQN
jgi:replicative DNA helicase